MDEDMLIVKLHLVHGNRWCDIAKQVDGRTDNAIKNRFNSNLSKRLKEPQFAKLLAEEGKLKNKLIDQEDSVTVDAKDDTNALEAKSEKLEAPKPNHFAQINDTSSSSDSSIKIHGSILKAKVQLGKPAQSLPIRDQNLSTLVTLSCKKRRDAKLAMKRGFSDYTQCRKISANSEELFLNGALGSKLNIREYQLPNLLRGIQQLRPILQRSGQSVMSTESQRTFNPKILIQKAVSVPAPAEQTVSNIWRSTFINQERSTTAKLTDLTTAPSVTLTPESIKITQSPNIVKRQKTTHSGGYVERAPLNENSSDANNDTMALLKQNSEEDAGFGCLNLILGPDAELVSKLNQVIVFSSNKSKRLAYSVPIFDSKLKSGSSLVSQSN